MASIASRASARSFLAENSEGPHRLFRLPERRTLRSISMAGHYEKAAAAAAQYQDIFGKRQLLPRNPGPGPRAGEARSTTISSAWRRELDIPLVATNDSHYLCGEDSHAHDVMLCVQTGSKIHDANRFQIRQRPVLRQERRRDGAHLSGLARRVAAHHGDCRALQPQAQHGRQSVS